MRYHKDIGWPESLRIPKGIVQLYYSTHAKERFRGKYKGLLILPSFIKLTNQNIFEIETKDRKNCSKVAVRISYDENKDICIVLNPSTGMVVTLWTNLKKDKHELINTNKYSTP